MPLPRTLLQNVLSVALRKIHIQEEERRLEDIAKEHGHMRSKNISKMKEQLARIDAIKKDLVDAFDMFDTERDGKVQQTHVHTILMSAGLIPTKKSLDAALRSMAPGPVSFAAVSALAKKYAYEVSTKEEMVRAFKEVFDKDDTNVVDAREVMEAAKNLGETSFSEEQLEALFDYCGVKEGTGQSREDGDSGPSYDASAVLQILWDK